MPGNPDQQQVRGWPLVGCLRLHSYLRHFGTFEGVHTARPGLSARVDEFRDVLAVIRHLRALIGQLEQRLAIAGRRLTFRTSRTPHDQHRKQPQQRHGDTVVEVHGICFGKSLFPLGNTSSFVRFVHSGIYRSAPTGAETTEPCPFGFCRGN